MSNIPVFSITANIGAGKSTILDRLQAHPRLQKVVVIPEPTSVWTATMMNNSKSVFENYYSDMGSYAGAFQLFVLHTRLVAIQAALDTKPDAILLERSPEDDWNIFASMLCEDGHITRDQMEMIEAYRGMVWYNVPEYWPKCIISINVAAETCLARIQGRNRSGEAGISVEFLRKLEDKSAEWLASCNTRVVAVNNNCDLDDEQFEQNIDAIAALICGVVEQV